MFECPLLVLSFFLVSLFLITCAPLGGPSRRGRTTRLVPLLVSLESAKPLLRESRERERKRNGK